MKRRGFTRLNDSTGENSSHQGEVIGGNNNHRRRARLPRSSVVGPCYCRVNKKQEKQNNQHFKVGKLDDWG